MASLWASDYGGVTEQGVAMRIGFVLGSIVYCALISPSPAAARYGFCMAQIPGRTTPIPNQYNTSYPSYLSDILDFGENKELEDAAARQFAASVGAERGNCFSHFEDVDAAIYWKSDLQEKQAGYNVETGWKGGFAAAMPVKRIAAPESQPTPPAKARPERPTTAEPVPASSKYVEVSGPDGATIRLSPEVAARNQAAADEYRRKLEEHAQAKADHDRKLAEHRDNAAKADAVMEAFRKQSEEHAATMRKHREDMASHQSKLARPPGSGGGPVEDLGLRKFQATGRYRKTREEAMQSLMLHQYASQLTDVQCAPAKGFENQWACWGFYLERTTRSGVSKQ